MAKNTEDYITTSIRIPKGLKERMDKFEKKYYLNTSALVRRALVEWVEKEEQKEQEKKKRTSV